MRAVLSSLMMLLPSLALATDVQGPLSGDTVWKRSGSPYVLTGDVTVGWGVRLTIESGVQVIAAAEDALKTGEDPKRVELIVDGTLLVRGTAERPVVFTSQGGEGSWYGIRVRGGRGTVIESAILNQAQQGISLGMSAVVKNTSVSAVARECIRVSWGTPTLENNELSGCGGGPPDTRGSMEPRGPRSPAKPVPPSLPEETPSPRVMAPPPTEVRPRSTPREGTASMEHAPAPRPPEPRPTPTPPTSDTMEPMAGRAAGRPTAPSEPRVTSPPEESPRVKPPSPVRERRRGTCPAMDCWSYQ